MVYWARFSFETLIPKDVSREGPAIRNRGLWRHRFDPRCSTISAMAFAASYPASRRLRCGPQRLREPLRIGMMPAKALIKKLLFKNFLLLDKTGLHVLPKHYYTPIADYTWLSSNRPSWARRNAMVGVCWDLDAQLNWLEEICKPYYAEVQGLQSYLQIVESRVGPGFGPIESQVLHCFVRSAVPNRVVEIGSGASTAVVLRAVDLNRREGKATTEITCIDPYPKEAFRRIEGISHIERFCQDTPASASNNSPLGTSCSSTRAMPSRRDPTSSLSS